MKQSISIVVALALLAGCAATGNRPHPYDRDSKQVKCKTCGQWYDGTPKKQDAEVSEAADTQQNVCPECGRATPEPDKRDTKTMTETMDTLGTAVRMAPAVVYGGIVLLFAAILGLAFG